MRTIKWNTLSETEKEIALQRPVDEKQDQFISETRKIIQQVREAGDEAVKLFTKKFDGVALNNFCVSPQEFSDAKNQVTSEFKQALSLAASQIRAFHQAQYPSEIRIENMPGIVCEKQCRAIQRVGLYVPGGTAPLVSTVLMLAIPAQIAGCVLKILCTPPRKDGTVDPHILYAAEFCGIDRVYKIGGAQAIAAMAYGTQTLEKVDKIFGPGNAWVTQAKLLVALDAAGASIDLPAGPSEVMVIADENANPIFVASDLLSQAEHGIDSQVILISTTEKFCEKVFIELNQLMENLPRKQIAQQSLQNSLAIVVEDLQAAVDIANAYAPEHLIIQTCKPRDILSEIHAAGSIFLGQWSPESVGDYASGTNHVLPTAGFARSVSGLSVQDFMLQMSVQELSKHGLDSIADAVQTLANIENLTAHALAIKVRMES